MFAKYLGENLGEEYATITEAGWAELELDDKPRILLAAGEFGTEVTSPVMWLIEEYGIDITCVRIEAYEHCDRILLNTQQVIPVTEAEEYMTKRREKQEKQESGDSYQWTLSLLLERGVLVPGDIVVFAESMVPEEAEREWDLEDDFWRGRVTGKQGQSDALVWLHDGNEYSFTGITREILHQLIGKNPKKTRNGFNYWTHPSFGNELLFKLREEGATAADRRG